MRSPIRGLPCLTRYMTFLLTLVQVVMVACWQVDGNLPHVRPLIFDHYHVQLVPRIIQFEPCIVDTRLYTRVYDIESMCLMELYI